MTSRPPEGWITISDVARRVGKTRQTIHNWVQSGFILTLGYRVRRDYTGYWLLAPPSTDELSAAAASPLSTSIR